MAKSPIYWRVNRHPRFTVLEMGAYMETDDGPRETVCRNMKFERMAQTLIYSKVRQAVEGYLTSPTRDGRFLQRCRQLLEWERDAATAPQSKQNAIGALRSLETFERALNGLPLGGIQLLKAPATRPLRVEGVSISVQPTALIRVARPRGRPLRGAIIVDLAKGDEPKTPVMQRRLTSAMEHSAFLLLEHVGTCIPDDEKPSPEHCLIFHSYRQELVTSPENYRLKMRNVEAACRNISRGWDAITPPPSFDSAFARFRN